MTVDCAVTVGKSITLQAVKPKRSSTNVKPPVCDMVFQILLFQIMAHSTLAMRSPDDMSRDK